MDFWVPFGLILRQTAPFLVPGFPLTCQTPLTAEQGRPPGTERSAL